MPDDTTIRKIGLSNESDYDIVDTMVRGRIGNDMGSAFSHGSDDGMDPNRDNGLGELIHAISLAVSHDLDNDVYEDLVLLEHGTYILNTWGYGRTFEFDKCFGGPFSTELNEAFLGSDRPSDITSIPYEVVERLSDIIGRGSDYSCAYVTVMAVREYSHGVTRQQMLDRAIGIEPHLEAEIREAAGCLLV